MHDRTNRRAFISGGVALAAAVALPAEVSAGDKGGGMYAVPATTENKCATCVFWGGMRRVSGDRSEVHVKSLGYCNNARSPNYRRMTSPDTGPMAAWVKWPALD